MPPVTPMVDDKAFLAKADRGGGGGPSVPSASSLVPSQKSLDQRSVLDVAESTSFSTPVRSTAMNNRQGSELGLSASVKDAPPESAAAGATCAGKAMVVEAGRSIASSVTPLSSCRDVTGASDSPLQKIGAPTGGDTKEIVNRFSPDASPLPLPLSLGMPIPSPASPSVALRQRNFDNTNEDGGMCSNAQMKDNFEKENMALVVESRKAITERNGDNLLSAHSDKEGTPEKHKGELTGSSLIHDKDEPAPTPSAPASASGLCRSSKCAPVSRKGHCQPASSSSAPIAGTEATMADACDSGSVMTADGLMVMGDGVSGSKSSVGTGASTGIAKPKTKKNCKATNVPAANLELKETPSSVSSCSQPKHLHSSAPLHSSASLCLPETGVTSHATENDTIPSLCSSASSVLQSTSPASPCEEANRNVKNEALDLGFQRTRARENAVGSNVSGKIGSAKEGQGVQASSSPSSRCDVELRKGVSSEEVRQEATEAKQGDLLNLRGHQHLGSTKVPEIGSHKRNRIRLRKRKPFSITCDTSMVESTSPLHLSHELDTSSPLGAGSVSVKKSTSSDFAVPSPKGSSAPEITAKKIQGQGGNQEDQGADNSCGRRNVTFSPTPPPPDFASTEKKKTPMRSPSTNYQNFPSIHDAKLGSPCGIFLSPYSPSASALAYGAICNSPSLDRQVQNRRGVDSTVTDARSGDGNSVKIKQSSDAKIDPEVSPGAKTKEQDRERGVATPTNFAIDFGKGHNPSPSFDASNVFSWLHSPTAQGLFSPGGLASSNNTPRGMYNINGTPRTPRTPTLGSSLFFSDAAELPPNEDFSSPKPVASPDTGSNKGGGNILHSGANMICISPLASSKRGSSGSGGSGHLPQHSQSGGGGDCRTNTTMSYSAVFESPRPPASREQEHVGTKQSQPQGVSVMGAPPSPTRSKQGTKSSLENSGPKRDSDLDVVHMAERDLMEDEDLSVLMQLANSSTPKSGAGPTTSADTTAKPGFYPKASGESSGVQKPQHQFKYRHNSYAKSGNSSGTTPPSLQLPLMSNRAGDGSPSKLSRKAAFRDHPNSQLDDFTPPPLAIRSSRSSSSSGSREIFLGGRPPAVEEESTFVGKPNKPSGKGKSSAKKNSLRRSSASNMKSTGSSSSKSNVNTSKQSRKANQKKEPDNVASSVAKSNKGSKKRTAPDGSSSSFKSHANFPLAAAASSAPPPGPYYPMSNASGAPPIHAGLGAPGSMNGQMVPKAPSANETAGPPHSSHPQHPHPPYSIPSGSSSVKQHAGAPGPPSVPGSITKKGAYGNPVPPHPATSSLQYPPPHSMYAHHPTPGPPPHMNNLGAPPPYLHYPPPHSHHHRPMYAGHMTNPQQGVAKATPKKEKKAKATKSGTKRQSSASPGQAKGMNAGPKKSKKASPKSAKKPKAPAANAAAATSAMNSPEDRKKSAAAIAAVNAASGGKNDKAAALAAAILRGVTMRPSGKWQAQLYYAGKSRYIGVFDSREKAALAYEIAREKLKADNKSPADQSAQTLKATEDAVNSARKAAFEGVNEQDRIPSK